MIKSVYWTLEELRAKSTFFRDFARKELGYYELSESSILASFYSKSCRYLILYQSYWLQFVEAGAS
jgi:hypothetical protein